MPDALVDGKAGSVVGRRGPVGHQPGEAPVARAARWVEWLAEVAEEEGSPASGSLTYRGLAERFDVSRQHISNIFDEAAQNGWYRISPGGEVALMPDHTLLQFETWVAGQMMHYRHLALAIRER
jgi:hypothetical protein